jgi:hypothetical protein
MAREEHGGYVSEYKEHDMTPEEKIMAMTKAITQAIKVMGDRFGSTEEDVLRAIQALKMCTQAIPTMTEPI